MTHDMIYNTFKEAVSVGMRNIAEASRRAGGNPNKEHRKKMDEKNLKAQSNLLDVDTANQGVPQITTSKEDIILAELKNLSADVKTLATVKEDAYDKWLDAMEKRMSAGGPNSSNP